MGLRGSPPALASCGLNLVADDIIRRT